MNNLTGKKIGRWTITKKLPRSGGHGFYRAKCVCGTKRVLREIDLKRNHSKSCGCLRVDRVTVHGMRYTTEYNSWMSMISRCTRKEHQSYPYYGGRGITICKRWDTFKNFIQDMGNKPTPSHSIDRIDNDKGYYPKNCKWSTKSQQRKNQRKRKCAK